MRLRPQRRGNRFVQRRGRRELCAVTENVAGLLSTHTTMGLFSSVIHVRDATGEAVCKALKNSVPNWPFRVSEQQAMTGAPQSPPKDTLLYLVSPLYGSWSTIVEGHFAVKDAPWLSDLAKCLSGALATYVLALMVHDDDVQYYDLCQDGANLDGYNSDPQYFETARLSEESIDRKSTRLNSSHIPLSRMPS